MYVTGQKGKSMKLNLIKIFFTYQIIALLSSTIVFSQTLTKEEKEKTINRISGLLAENYVFPEKGEEAGDHLKSKLEDGSFDSITDKKEFTIKLTEELQNITKDKHMRATVQKAADDNPENINPLFDEFRRKKNRGEENYGFSKVEMLEDGIALIDLRGFSPVDAAFKAAQKVMSLIQNSNAVIFDLRNNHGGSPEMIVYLLSYFFEKPTHINSLYWRRGDVTEEFWTKEKIDGKKMSDVPLFVLTSSTTFSAGEEFTYDIQTQKRGLIIGEVTGGGANPGQFFELETGIGIFIPTGMAINPITKTNWEGVGVKPDIETSADDALNKTLEVAKVEAEKYRQKILNDAEKKFDELSNNINEAIKFLDEDPRAAEEKIYSSLNQSLGINLIDELDINFLGYTYLWEKNYSAAIMIFNFNTEKFPGSFNVWDSLGEAYMESGNKELAIMNYKKSLELNPDNKNAKDMLARMESGG